MEGHKTVGESGYKEKWNKISLHSHIPFTLQLDIQAESAKEKNCNTAVTKDEKNDY